MVGVNCSVTRANKALSKQQTTSIVTQNSQFDGRETSAGKFCLRHKFLPSGATCEIMNLNELRTGRQTQIDKGVCPASGDQIL